jgi:hypothetical protein
MQLAGMPEQRCKAAVSPNYRHVGVFPRARRRQNGRPAIMTKRNPHSGTITPQSGPDRRSLLMGTAV